MPRLSIVLAVHREQAFIGECAESVLGQDFADIELVAVDEALARQHYAVHEGKPFFAGLIEYITSAPVVVAVYEGREAVAVVRATVGATNPVNAAPGTIRGDWALEIGRNLGSPQAGLKPMPVAVQGHEVSGAVNPGGQLRAALDLLADEEEDRRQSGLSQDLEHGRRAFRMRAVIEGEGDPGRIR